MPHGEPSNHEVARMALGLKASFAASAGAPRGRIVFQQAD